MVKARQYSETSFLGTKFSYRPNDKPLAIAIGVLAILLGPMVWFFWSLHPDSLIHDSISHYYYSVSRDYFEGVLFFVGVFLIFYRGHQHIDRLITSVAGVLALGVATFPCGLLPGSVSPDKSIPQGVFQLPGDVSDTIHMTSAITFFGLLSLYMLTFFTFHDAHETETPEGKRKHARKVARNAIYRVCSIAMFVTIATCLINWLLKSNGMSYLPVDLFWFEFAMLVFFGVAWIVKSGAVSFLEE